MTTIRTIRAIHWAIDLAKELPATSPAAARARHRALALLWAAVEELEPSLFPRDGAAASGAGKIDGNANGEIDGLPPS